jgi:hypothetical protein
MSSVNFEKRMLHRQEDGTVIYEVKANGILIGKLMLNRAAERVWLNTKYGALMEFPEEEVALETLYQRWIESAVN